MCDVIKEEVTMRELDNTETLNSANN